MEVEGPSAEFSHGNAGRYFPFFVFVLFAACLILLPNTFLAAQETGASGPSVDLTQEERAFLHAHPVLRLGIGVAFPPFQYVEEEAGKPAFKGITSDYAKLLGQRLGVRMEPVFGIPFKRALEMGEAGEIDVFPAVAKTPERQKFLIYTKPYVSYPLVIMTRDDVPFIGSVEGLHGKKVAIVKTLATYSKFQNDFPRLSVDFHFEKDIPSVLTAVSLGKADACVVNLAVASYLINSLGLSNLRVAAPTPWGGNDLAMAVRNDWPILAGILQKALDSLSIEETNAIVQHWIALRYESRIDPWIVNRVLIPGGAAAAIILGLVIWWNRRLRKEVKERERAERALQESEDRFSSAFDASPSAMAISGIDDARLFEANREWLSLMGYTRDEVIGKTPAEMGQWSYLERRSAFIATLKRDGSVRDFETSYLAEDGKERSAHLSGEIVEIGGEQRLLFTLNDITARKEMERAIHESEERFSKAFHANPAAMVISKIDDGQIIDLNDRWLSLMGFSREEALGKTAAQIGGWVDIGQRSEFVELLKRDGSARDFVAELNTKNGEIRTVIFSGETIETGGEQCMLLVFYDVTELQVTERALRESENRLRAVFDNTPVCLNLKDTEGRYLLINKPYEEWFGRSAEEVIGKKASEFLPDVEDVENLTDAEQRVLESGEITEIAVTPHRVEREVLESGESVKQERRFRRYDGTLHDRLVIKYPVKAEDGSITAIGTVAIDVTERKFMERQLHHAQKMEAVGQLTGGIAHDFNNLLQVIQGNLELAIGISERDAGRIRECVERALRAGQRGGKLTQQLLAFSRKQTLNPETADPNQLIEEMLEILVRTLGEDIEIETSQDVGIQPITIDRNGLENAIFNLSVNAKAAMPKGGKLSIKCAGRSLIEDLVTEDGQLPAGRYVEISVADTGIGMSPDVLARAVEPFYTTREVGEGSGLGLSMVYGFIRQSGGRLTLESEIGKGTTVRIWIPVAQDEVDRSLTETENAETDQGVGIGTILVVEDDSDVRKSAVIVLEAYGFVTREAEDGVAALEVLEQDDSIDVLFSDVVMPKGMSGLDLAQEATRRYPGLKVVLTSGYPEAELEKSGLLQSGYSLLGKPYSNEQLREALKKSNTG